MKPLNKDPCKRAMKLSFLISFLMLLGKFSAYLLTNSTAIFSDAAESILHLGSTSIAGFSLWYSKRPADLNHQYGHGKIAYFSVAAEAAIILLAAISILYMAIDSLIHFKELNRLDMGLLILSALTAINFFLGKFLIKTGETHHSLVLVANGKHAITDMWTSLGVIIGVFVVYLTNLIWLDPIFAVLVGINIIWTAGGLLKESFEGLMEKVEEETHNTIESYLKEAVEYKEIASFHQLRHRKVNERLWIEIHLTFQEDLSIKEAHRRASNIEVRLMKAFPQNKLYITSHLEPAAHEESHPKDHPELHNIS